MSDTKALIKYVRDRLNDGPNITFGKSTARDLIDALEQAESRAEKAEADVVRLTKMVGWLAERCAEHCCDRWGCDRTCRVNGCAHENGMCSKPEPKEWKEAARRAVDYAESEVEK